MDGVRVMETLTIHFVGGPLNGVTRQQNSAPLMLWEGYTATGQPLPIQVATLVAVYSRTDPSPTGSATYTYLGKLAR